MAPFFLPTVMTCLSLGSTSGGSSLSSATLSRVQSYLDLVIFLINTIVYNGDSEPAQNYLIFPWVVVWYWGGAVLRRPRLAATELLRDSCRVSSGISTNHVKEKTKKGKYESQDMAVC